MGGGTPENSDTCLANNGTAPYDQTCVRVGSKPRVMRVGSGHQILTRAKVNFFINLPDLDPKKFSFSNHHSHKEF